jgi:hypothetical protein
MKNKVITIALAAHTLKFAIRSTFHSKDGSKKSIHVHKAIEEYMLERFKQMSMWSNGRQISVKRPSMLILSLFLFYFML